MNTTPTPTADRNSTGYKLGRLTAWTLLTTVKTAGIIAAALLMSLGVKQIAGLFDIHQAVVWSFIFTLLIILNTLELRQNGRTIEKQQEVIKKQQETMQEHREVMTKQRETIRQHKKVLRNVAEQWIEQK